jgi:hypothetical protein
MPPRRGPSRFEPCLDAGAALVSPADEPDMPDLTPWVAVTANDYPSLMRTDVVRTCVTMLPPDVSRTV